MVVSAGSVGPRKSSGELPSTGQLTSRFELRIFLIPSRDDEFRNGILPIVSAHPPRPYSVMFNTVSTAEGIPNTTIHLNT